jgi:hypothetical protein
VDRKREYQGLDLSKRETEWVSWYQLGADSWWDAFYQYKNRRKRIREDRQAKSWFNSVLLGLKNKGLFLHVPFAFISHGGICWAHPGFQNDGYIAETKDEEAPDFAILRNPIL